MARIRTIKPEFWTDDKLTDCSLSARLLFIGTWNFADDAGNLDRSAKQIKARIFPVDNIDCEPLIVELIAHGLLSEYSCDGKKYLHIHGFSKHQIINRPSKPTCPAFDESSITHVTLTEPSLSAHDGREGKGRKERNTSAKAAGFCFKTELLNLGVSPDLVRDWMAVRKSKKATNTRTALDSFLRNVEKSGWTVEAAVTHCVEKDWKGFDAEWVKDIKPASDPVSLVPRIDTSLESRRAGLQAQADAQYRERKWLDGERRYRAVITIENGQLVRTKHYEDQGAAA